MSTHYSHAAWIGLALLCLHTGVRADQDKPSGQADAGAAIPSIEVIGSRDDRDQKSYRGIVAGMEVFEKNHQLAPDAVLRFKVLPRQAGVKLEGLTMHIHGAHTTLAVALDKEMAFTLPRSATAAADDALVISNRKAKSLTWRAEIRSPGVPAKARRLGDLMLECKVAMAADLIAYIPTPINLIVAKMADPCRSIPINIPYFTERPLFSVTLVHGARRSVLPAAQIHGPDMPILAAQQDWWFLRDRTFILQFKPLYDQNWPDDTLLEFDYMDDDVVSAAKPSPTLTQAQ